MSSAALSAVNRGYHEALQLRQRCCRVHPNNLLNVIGSNTIAIYTTHRILIEAFSLLMIREMNAAYWPIWAELTLILVYPFISLLVCTLAGLGARKLSTALFGDSSSPPARLSPVPTTRTPTRPIRATK